MVTGAVQAKYGIEEIPEDLYEDLMGYSASSENYGNFYGQNILLLPVGYFSFKAFSKRLALKWTF